MNMALQEPQQHIGVWDKHGVLAIQDHIYKGVQHDKLEKPAACKIARNNDPLRGDFASNSDPS